MHTQTQTHKKNTKKGQKRGKSKRVCFYLQLAIARLILWGWLVEQPSSFVLICLKIKTRLSFSK